MRTAILMICLLGATPLPKGWKDATLAKKSYCGGVAKDTDLRTVRADFDGDGKEDTARLLEKKADGSFGIWVWFAGKEAPQLAAALGGGESRPDIGIAEVEPGDSGPTACGKGFFDCAPNEPETLVLRNAAISMMFCESSAATVYWNVKAKRFRTVWISD